MTALRTTSHTSALASIDRLLYPKKEAAFAPGVSVRTIGYLIAGKQLNTRRIGKRVLIPAGEISALPGRITRESRKSDLPQ
ncbi:MAG: hypothetical protein WCE63_22235 [Acidobacteriaceae bacterium]